MDVPATSTRSIRSVRSTRSVSSVRSRRAGHAPLKPSARRAAPGGSRRAAAVVFMLINVATWGAALPISKFAVESTSPYHFLFFRFGLAFLLSLPILVWHWWRLHPRWRDIVTVVLLELLGASLALGCLYLGLAETSSLEASFLVTTIPVFVTIGGIWWLHERQEKHEWAGLVMAVGGTLLLVFEPLINGRSQWSNFSFWGNVLILTSNILTATYYLLAKKYYRHMPKLFVSPLSFAVGAVTFLIISWLDQGGSWPQLLGSFQTDLSQPLVLWPSLYMAIFGSIIGLTAYIAGQDRMEASEASVFSYLQPLVYIPLAMSLHGDMLTPLMVLAVAVIAVGVWLTEKRTH